MNHIFLSPHLDDAIYSCGGRIYRLRKAGEAVTVINFCAGKPKTTRLSPLAKECHQSWGESLDPINDRLEEDDKALNRWQVSGIYWPTPDGIYRLVADRIAYPDQAALFSEPHPKDNELLSYEWMSRWQGLQLDKQMVTIYSPLSAGGHVDHVLVCQFARKLAEYGWNVWYYEDFPHAYNQQILDTALIRFGNVKWKQYNERINLEEKLTAMLDYRSQIGLNFGNALAMENKLRRYASDRAVAIDFKERFRKMLAGSGGRREILWRKLFGYHSYAERYWFIPKA